MIGSGSAGLTTADHLGPGRSPGLEGWVFQREVSLAHRGYWQGCRGPLRAVLSVLLYPLWVAVAIPIAFLLGLVKMALLGALLAAVVAGAARRPALAAAPAAAKRR